MIFLKQDLVLIDLSHVHTLVCYRVCICQRDLLVSVLSELVVVCILPEYVDFVLVGCFGYRIGKAEGSSDACQAGKPVLFYTCLTD